MNEKYFILYYTAECPRWEIYNSLKNLSSHINQNLSNEAVLIEVEMFIRK